MEITVGDDLGVGLIIGIGVYVGKIGIKSCTVNCECGCIKYMNFAGKQLGLDVLKVFYSAFSSSLLVDLGKNNGAGLKSASPVSLKLFACSCLLDGILEVRSPIDTGGYDEGVGACIIRIFFIIQ